MDANVLFLLQGQPKQFEKKPKLKGKDTKASVQDDESEDVNANAGVKGV